VKQSGEGLLWAKEGAARALWNVRTASVEALGLAELEHNAKNNRMRALAKKK
jgi:hypothetical protein